MRDQEKLSQPFVKLGTEFFFCERFLTKEEFENVSLATWISFLPDDKKLAVTSSFAG